MDDMKIDVAAEYSMFLNNLEQWINGLIVRDGLTDKQLVAKIKESFDRSIQANIEHHRYMSENSDIDKYRNRHKLMVKVYKELL